MRLIVALLLLTLTVPAWAEWLKYAEDKEVVFYYDPTTIKKTGNLRRVWEIEDLKKRPTDGESSSHMMFEYDCKEQRYRGLSFRTHSEPMASGKIIFRHDKPSTWRDVVPNSGRATILQIVCK